jgi:hypothetical protein
MATAADAVTNSEPSASTPASRARDVVGGSILGEVLYEDGAAGAADRIAVLKVLHSVGGGVVEALPGGVLASVELPTDGERLVFRLHEQGGVFVRGGILQ